MEIIRLANKVSAEKNLIPFMFFFTSNSVELNRHKSNISS
jgi:hypothetical protein